MEIEEINIQLGDKFPTENKLLRALGFPNSSGNTRLSYIKIAKQYVNYEKTGKIHRGNETAEIVITEKYIIPIEKEDKRQSEVIKWLKPLIIQIQNKSLGHKKLLFDELALFKEEYWKLHKGDNRVEFYKYYLLNDFKSKVKTSLRQLYKENDWFYYSYDYMLITQDESETTYEIADQNQTAYINAMKENIKDRIMAKHKLINPTMRNKVWKNLAYRYTSMLYKMLNDECHENFNCNRCVDVVTINGDNTNICERVALRDNIRKYYKNKMNEWIIKNNYTDYQNIIEIHNKLFEDVK